MEGADINTDEEQAIQGRQRLLTRFQGWYRTEVIPAIAEVQKESSEHINALYEQIIGHLRDLPDHAVISIDEFVDRITKTDESWRKFKSNWQKLMDNVCEFASNNPDHQKLADFFQGGTKSFLDIWYRSALEGWYIYPTAIFASISAAIDGGALLDQFMVTYLATHREKLIEVICNAYPDRSTIVRVAFKLHDEGNYIASIPLFLAQTDGICSQELGVYLFSERKKRTDIIDSLRTQVETEVVGELLSSFIWRTQVGGPASDASEAHKANGPNRNGILHGSRRHLDYGTSINSHKALSLLLFVVAMLSPDGPARTVIPNAVSLSVAALRIAAERK